MDFSSYYYYIPLNFYETPEMTLIDHEPNGDSATVLVLALAKIHTRTVTKNDDGTFTIVTDDGTFTDTEVMEMLSSFGYRAPEPVTNAPTAPIHGARIGYRPPATAMQNALIEEIMPA